MISDLGKMEESSTAGGKQETEGLQAEQGPRIMLSPSGMFELPPEASDQIITLHKEMEEMVRMFRAAGGARV